MTARVRRSGSLFLVILGLLARGLAVLCVELWRELGIERARNEAYSARLADSPGPPPIAAAPADTPGSAGRESSVATATATQDASPGENEDSFAQERRLLANPKYRAARLAEMRLRYPQWRD